MISRYEPISVGFFSMHLQRHMSKSYSAQALWILLWKQHKHRAWISVNREKYALAICAAGPAVYPGKGVRSLLLIWEQGAQASAKFLLEKWIKYCLVLVKEKHVALGGYSQFTSTNYKPLPPVNLLERGAHLEFSVVACSSYWFLRSAGVEDTLYRNKGGDFMDFDLSAPVFWYMYLTSSESNKSEVALLENWT